MAGGDDPGADELIRSAREGGEVAFRALARRVLPRVRRWAIGLTGRPDYSDEVAQRVLIRLHRHLGSYDETQDFESWLYAVTRNAARDFLASERDHVAFDESLAGDPGNDPIEQIASGRTAELVRVLAEELPTRQREVFDLVDLRSPAGPSSFSTGVTVRIGKTVVLGTSRVGSDQGAIILTVRPTIVDSTFASDAP